MRAIVRRLRSPTAGSVVAGLGIQAALVVSGPILARMLGLEGRGQLAALILWPIVIAQLGSLGLPLAITYFIAQRRASVRSITRAALSFAIPQTLLLMALHGAVLLLVLRGESSSLRLAGIATMAIVPAFLAREYGLAMLQGQQRFAVFNTLRMLPTLVYAGGVATLFVVDASSILAVVLVMITANTALGGITLLAGILAAGGADTAAGPANLREMLRFGLRGLFGSVSPIESFRLDQMVIAIFLTPAALGLYVVGLAFMNLPRFIAQGIGMVAYPSVASQEDESAARRSMWRFLSATIVMSGSVAILLALAAGWLVPQFFGDEFKGAIPITQILLIGVIFTSARRALVEGMRGRGHPTAGTIAEVVAWFWLAPALVVAAPLWGAIGVAGALSSSYAFSFGVLLIVTARLGEMPSLRLLPVSLRTLGKRAGFLSAAKVAVATEDDPW